MKTMCSRIVVVACALLLGVSQPAYSQESTPLTGSQRRKVEAYRQLAREFRAEKNWTKAKENLLEIVAIDKKDLAALNDLAWIYNETNAHERAAVFALAVLNHDTENGEAWRELGYALMKQGDHDKAVKALKVATTLRPTDRTARDYLEEAEAKLEGQEKTENRKPPMVRTLPRGSY